MAQSNYKVGEALFINNEPREIAFCKEDVAFALQSMVNRDEINEDNLFTTENWEDYLLQCSFLEKKNSTNDYTHLVLLKPPFVPQDTEGELDGEAGKARKKRKKTQKEQDSISAEDIPFG